MSYTKLVKKCSSGTHKGRIHRNRVDWDNFVETSSSFLYSSKYLKRNSTSSPYSNFLPSIFSCFNCLETNNVGGKIKSENPDCVSVIRIETQIPSHAKTSRCSRGIGPTRWHNIARICNIGGDRVFCCGKKIRKERYHRTVKLQNQIVLAITKKRWYIYIYKRALGMSHPTVRKPP